MEFWEYKHYIPEEYWNLSYYDNNYFNPYEGIEVYSSALRPEERQPSETCKTYSLSEINNITLFYNQLIFNLLGNKSDKFNILFTYDYDKIKESRTDLNKEIIKRYYKPENIDKWIHEIEE
jgi:hypothetical protein